jgi:hypothetical protein
MNEENSGMTVAKISEINSLICDFKEKFKLGTSNVDEFITINEIERMWSELLSNTQNIYSDIVRDLMAAVDERELIRKKKRISKTWNNTSNPCESSYQRPYFAWRIEILPISANTEHRKPEGTLDS